MTKFFTLSDDSFSHRGFPWISHLVEGFGLSYYCKREKRSLHYATGEMVAQLEPKKGTKWSDALGCGAFPFLIVSEYVVECWAKEGVGTFPIHEVRIAAPFPKKLSGTTPPRYFWIDGAKLKEALIDFRASGFVGVKFCPECGNRTENISKTFDNQYAKGAKFSYVFRERTWNGLNLFTTDISDTAFFCTEALVECAHKHKFTNFRFIPVEEGHGW